ncbi:MAG: outer membrane beta-barrel protein [Longimicrobiales bacterium]
MALRTLALILLLVGLPLTSTQAQERGKVEFQPFVGAILFNQNLVGEDNADLIKLNDQVFLGGTLGIWFGRVGVEGIVGYSPTNVETVDVTGTVTASSNQGYLIYGGDVLFQAAQGPSADFLVLGGIGMKSYSANSELGLESQTDFTYNFGIASHVWARENLALRFEVRDFISSYEGPLVSNTQHDLFFSVGLSVFMGPAWVS